MSFSTKARPNLIIQTGDPVVGSNGTFAYNSTTNEFVVNYDGKWVPLEETEGSSLEPTTIFFRTSTGPGPDNSYTIQTNVVADSQYLDNIDVTHVTLGRGSTLGTRAFRGCSITGNLFIPKETVFTGIEQFYRNNLATVKIEEGVTFLSPRMFADNDTLLAINYPNSLTDIQEATAKECSSELHAYIDLEADEWKDFNTSTGLYGDTQNTFLTNTNTTLHISPLRDIAPYQIPWVDGSSAGNWADRNEYNPASGSVVVWTDYPNLPY
jgi:hypothetical protein